MAECAQHPGVPAAGECSRCSRTLCADCLVEIHGSTLCESCKAGVLADLQAGDRALPLRIIRWTIAWDLLMAVLAPLGAALEGAWQSFEAYYRLGAGGWLSQQDAWPVYLLVGGIGSLLALLPALLLWQRRPSGYVAQWVSLVAVPVLSVVWAEYGAVLITASALVLIHFWRKPEVRRYCTEEMP